MDALDHRPRSSPRRRGALPTTTRRGFLRSGALLAGGGTLLAACGGSSSSSSGAGGDGGSGSTEVAVSLPAGGNSLSIWKPVSERLHLRAPDVSLRWVGGDPGQLQTQFLAGTVDISTFGPLGTALALLQGDAIAIVGPGIYGHNKWIVADSSPAKTIADLRGKKIATNLATAEAFRAMQLIIAMQGGDPEHDYDWVHTQTSAAVALFERGSVDGVYIGEPNATKLVAAGARQISSIQDEWSAVSGSEEPLFNAGPTVRRQWVDEHRRAAGGAVGILTRASTALAADPSQLTAVADAIGLRAGDAKAVGLLPQRMADVYMAEFGARQRAALDDVVALGVKHGILPRAPQGKVYGSVTAT